MKYVLVPEPAEGVLRAGNYLARPAVTTSSWFLVAMTSALAIKWIRSRHLEEAAALTGFQPTGLVHPVWERPDFVADFPNGEAEALKSFIGQIYQAAGHLPFSNMAIATAGLFLEILAVMAGAFACVRAVGPATPRWMAFATAVLLASSSIANSDIASFFHPYYGSVYNFATGAGLTACAAIFVRRPILAGLALGIAGIIHPIIGLFFGIVVVVAALLRWRDYRLTELVGGGAIALLIAGTWSLAMFRSADVSGIHADTKLYFDLTQMMSVHWYPVQRGAFGKASGTHLLPCLGLLTIFSLSIPAVVGDKVKSAQLGAAVVVLVLVTAIGVLISEWSVVPLLLKLALHRASLFALILASITVVPFLLMGIVSGSLLRAALSAMLLLLPFWRANGLPILLCLAFALVIMVEERSERSHSQQVLTGALIILSTTVFTSLYAAGLIESPGADVYSGIAPLGEPLFWVCFALSMIAWLVRIPAVLALAILIALTVWVPKMDLIRSEAGLAQARAFLDVQRWARASTPTGSLFMTDPGQAYGWREHSERPSFGTLREWLYSGWIYNTQLAVMKEGLRRAGVLGLRVDDYIAADRTAPGTVRAKITRDASQAYHSKDDAWRRQMARDEQIRFFVMDKTKMAGARPSDVVFENDRYLVVKP